MMHNESQSGSTNFKATLDFSVSIFCLKKWGRETVECCMEFKR